MKRLRVFLRPYEFLLSEVPRLHADFLSFTIDTSLLLGGHWWGPTKGVRHGVAGDKASPLDLSDPRLRAYAKALSPAMLRIGGTEADRMCYRMGKNPVAIAGNQATPSPQSVQASLQSQESRDDGKGLSHEFVLRKGLWKRLHDFITDAGYSLLFTLSAGPADRNAEGAWLEENARRLITWSLRKKYPVAAWELGNEVNAFPFIHGIKSRVFGKRYAEDFERLGSMVRGLDPEADLVGPCSAVWPGIGEPNPLIRTLCSSPAAMYLDAVSWHWYPQQSSFGRVATRRANEGNMLNARRLNEVSRRTARVDSSRALAATRRPSGKPPENWVTETAHALYGGEPGLSDTFVSTLWWLDELGLLASLGVSKVFRQALVGARYGLLDGNSMDPRPDYFASFLWKRLMGRQVLTLPPKNPAGSKLRIYAHADKAGQTASRTILAINTSRKSTFILGTEGTAAKNHMDRYLLQGDGSFASRTLLVNGIRAGADLVFGWGKKNTRTKYRVAAGPGKIPDDESPAKTQVGLDIDLPPLSALFLRFE